MRIVVCLRGRRQGWRSHHCRACCRLGFRRQHCIQRSPRSAWCILCSGHRYIEAPAPPSKSGSVKRGDKKRRLRRRFGHKSNYRCKCCDVQLCVKQHQGPGQPSCFVRWHTQQRLQRPQVTPPGQAQSPRATQPQPQPQPQHAIPSLPCASPEARRTATRSCKTATTPAPSVAAPPEQEATVLAFPHRLPHPTALPGPLCHHLDALLSSAVATSVPAPPAVTSFSSSFNSYTATAVPTFSLDATPVSQPASSSSMAVSTYQLGFRQASMYHTDPLSVLPVHALPVGEEVPWNLEELE